MIEITEGNRSKQIHEKRRDRVRKPYLTRRRLGQRAKTYTDLFGVNDQGKSAASYPSQFEGRDQIRILRLAEEELFPALYQSWLLIECRMAVEKGNTKEPSG